MENHSHVGVRTHRSWPTRLLATIEDVSSVIIVCVICLTVLFQVLSRFIFKVPLSWTEELSRFALIWLTFVAASVALREDGHFAVDVIAHRLSDAAKKRYRSVVLLVMLVYLSVIFYTGLQIVPVAHMQESAALDVHMSYVYLSIPVGAGLMILNVMIKIFELFKTQGGAH